MITAMPRIAIAADDFEGILATFRDIFGMPVVDLSEHSVDRLGAKIAMCVPRGGSNIELMSPANLDAPLSQSLQGFLDRRGKGLFALMLEAPVPDDEAEILLSNGLNVLPLMPGAEGRDIHPKSTHGVLIRVYPDNSFQETREQTEKSLAISGVSRVMIAVKDLDQAMVIYGEKLGIPVDPVIVDEERGLKSALCHPPKGGDIELVSVHDQTKPLAQSIAEHLETKGEGMYALVLQAPATGNAVEELKNRGLEARESEDEAFEMDVFGARIRIELA